MKIFLLLITLFISHAALALDLDSYLGDYLFSKRDSDGTRVDDRPGATVVKDVIYVAPLARTFTRYTFSSGKTFTFFTIYQDGLEFFTSERDRSTLWNEADFRDRPLYIGDDWVPLKWNRETNALAVFYPNSWIDRVKVEVQFKVGQIELVTRGKSLWGLPLKEKIWLTRVP